MVSAQDVDYAIARWPAGPAVASTSSWPRSGRRSTSSPARSRTTSRAGSLPRPSKIDSRSSSTRAGRQVARMGDMLFMPELSALLRLHCSYVSIRSPPPCQVRQGAGRAGVRRAADHVIKSPGATCLEDETGEGRNYEKRGAHLHTGQASASYLQRKLSSATPALRASSTRWSRTASSAVEGSKPREILIDIKRYMRRRKRRGEDA